MYLLDRIEIEQPGSRPKAPEPTENESDPLIVRMLVRRSVYERLKRMNDDPDAQALVGLTNPVDGDVQMTFREGSSRTRSVCSFEPVCEGNWGRPAFVFFMDRLTIPKGNDRYYNYNGWATYPVLKDEIIDGWTKDLLKCFKEQRSRIDAAIAATTANDDEPVEFPARNTRQTAFAGKLAQLTADS